MDGAVAVLGLMYDPSTTDIIAAVDHLRTLDPSLAAFIIDNSDLSSATREQLAYMGLNLTDSRVKDLVIQAATQSYRPRPNRFYVAPSYLLVQEFTPDNVESWAKFLIDAHWPTTFVDLVLSYLISRYGGINISSSGEMQVMRAMKGAYRPRHAFWDTVCGKAYIAFRLHHDSGFHRSAWLQMLGHKKTVIQGDFIKQLLRPPMNWIHFLWTVQAFFAQPDSVNSIHGMPADHDVRALFPSHADEYKQLMNMLRIMQK